MRTFGHLVVGGLILGLFIAGVGCNGGGTASGDGISTKQARLFEEENYRLTEQVKVLEKQLAELKAATEAERKEWIAHEEASGTAMKFMMDQIAEKDAEIEKLHEKIAGTAD